MSNNQPLYNLWHSNNLILERATWREVECEMGERCLHKRDVDIEIVDGDVA